MKHELTIGIPTFNRATVLSGLLTSLDELKPVPFSWNVFVIDNGSSDHTKQIVEQFAAKSNLHIEYLLEERKGLHNCRNRLLRDASAPIVALLDDDVILFDSWLQGARRLFDGSADAVVGKILPKWPSPPPEWLLSLFDDGVFGPLALLDLGDEPKQVASNYIFGCNCLLRREQCLDAGGFNPDSFPPEQLRFRGDGETGLFAKLNEQNAKCFYDPIAAVRHVIHPERMSKEYIAKRYYHEGISYSFTTIRKGERDTEKNIALANTNKSKTQAGNLTDVKKEMRLAFWDGFIWHQQQVANDSSLRSFILQENFLPKD